MIKEKVKKYGVLSYTAEPTYNIGDDIQTLAAIDLLKENNINHYIPIDRERLSSYHGEPISLVMNGWFMNNIDHFPPSPEITPLFIAFHCQYEEIIKNNISYFKEYEPIGCRDEYTKKLFEKYDVEAYFSGCLTLSFSENFEKRGAESYLVDIYMQNEKFNNVDHWIAHWPNGENIARDFNTRIEKANSLLNLYRSAKLIMTSRLHCTLPCRAFNTDVIFIHDNYKSDPRFEGL